MWLRRLLTHEHCAWPEGEHGAAIQTWRVRRKHGFTCRTIQPADTPTLCWLCTAHSKTQSRRNSCLLPEHPLCLEQQRTRRCFCMSPRRRRRQRLFTPSRSLPSSSPMRSSFQVQQSSINLIHSPTPSSGREPAASAWRDNRRVRPPPQPGRRSCCCACVRRSLPAAPHAASSGTILRRCIQESLWPMKLLGRGEEDTGRPTRNRPRLINAFLYGRGGGVMRKPVQ